MSYGHHIPVIQMTVSGMQHTVSVALTQHAAQMDKDIQKAVEDYCKPDNIKLVVREAARNALDQAIKQEIDAFFRYGDGRKQIAAAVKEKLLKRKTFTSLDDE